MRGSRRCAASGSARRGHSDVTGDGVSDTDQPVGADRGEARAPANLAVVAGDTLAPPARPSPWSRGRRRGPAGPPARRGAGAPFGFVPLAVLAVLFLALPLVALVLRAPWSTLLSDLPTPGS